MFDWNWLYFPSLRRALRATVDSLWESAVALGFCGVEVAPPKGEIMLTALDHVLLGTGDLERGVEWVEKQTGVRAVLGGAHPGRGTRNALLALGPSCYLEIIAPDPQQQALAWFSQILSLAEPRLIAWAMHTTDIAAVAMAAQAAGFDVDGPLDGARTRPDGKTLRWKSFRLKDDRGGLFPFFIEWSRDSSHPAQDAPPGCQIESLGLHSPDSAKMTRALQALSADVPVQPAEKPGMILRLTSPKGEVEFTS